MQANSWSLRNAPKETRARMGRAARMAKGFALGLAASAALMGAPEAAEAKEHKGDVVYHVTHLALDDELQKIPRNQWLNPKHHTRHPYIRMTLGKTMRINYQVSVVALEACRNLAFSDNATSEQMFEAAANARRTKLRGEGAREYDKIPHGLVQEQLREYIPQCLAKVDEAADMVGNLRRNVKGHEYTKNHIINTLFKHIPGLREGNEKRFDLNYSNQGSVRNHIESVSNVRHEQIAADMVQERKFELAAEVDRDRELAAAKDAQRRAEARAKKAEARAKAAKTKTAKAKTGPKPGDPLATTRAMLKDPGTRGLLTQILGACGDQDQFYGCFLGIAGQPNFGWQGADDPRMDSLQTAVQTLNGAALQLDLAETDASKNYLKAKLAKEMGGGAEGMQAVALVESASQKGGFPTGKVIGASMLGGTLLLLGGIARRGRKVRRPGLQTGPAAPVQGQPQGQAATPARSGIASGFDEIPDESAYDNPRESAGYG